MLGRCWSSGGSLLTTPKKGKTRAKSLFPSQKWNSWWPRGITVHAVKSMWCLQFVRSKWYTNAWVVSHTTQCSSWFLKGFHSGFGWPRGGGKKGRGHPSKVLLRLRALHDVPTPTVQPESSLSSMTLAPFVHLKEPTPQVRWRELGCWVWRREKATVLNICILMSIRKNVKREKRLKILVRVSLVVQPVLKHESLTALAGGADWMFLQNTTVKNLFLKSEKCWRKIASAPLWTILPQKHWELCSWLKWSNLFVWVWESHAHLTASIAKKHLKTRKSCLCRNPSQFGTMLGKVWENWMERQSFFASCHW